MKGCEEVELSGIRMMNLPTTNFYEELSVKITKLDLFFW